LDAIQLGYRTRLIFDGCRGVNVKPDDVRQAVEEMTCAGVESLSSSDVITAMERVQRREHPGRSGPVPVEPELLAETPHLELVRRDGWDFVRRRKASGVVAIIALTAESELLLIEQYRPAVDARVIELPAGLAGDVAGTEHETLEEAAHRELLEETGYRAADIRRVFEGTSSAGLTNEMTTFLIAQDLEQITSGGGDSHEDIQVHRVPFSSVDQWLQQKVGQGIRVDARVPSGIYLLTRETGETTQ
jgi:ADP-ribose pyrophosphatase